MSGPVAAVIINVVGRGTEGQAAFEVFVAFDPSDADRAAELIRRLEGALDGLACTSDPQEAPLTGLPGLNGWLVEQAVNANVHDVIAGGVRGPRPDEEMVRRADGLIALIGPVAAESPVIHRQLETAYSAGRPVLGVRVDRSTMRPRNLARIAAHVDDPDRVADTVAAWWDDRDRRAAMGWPRRLWHALRADRDARR